MQKVIKKFLTYSEATSCVPYGGGHINSTFLVECATGHRYILQKVNTFVFTDPVGLMENIVMVTEHLQKSGLSHALSLVPCAAGNMWHIDECGEFWRMFNMVENSVCLEKTDSIDVFRESGLAFGGFINFMSDFDASKLRTTIPDFHNTPKRFAALRQAIAADPCGRVKDVGHEIDFALAREDFAPILVDLQQRGDIPTRVTHNDTKLSNLLFHRDSLKALCVIDLDTVMPGLAVTDFGDSIRAGAVTADEDEGNLGKVNFSLPLYRAYKEGFLAACNVLSPCEIEHLPHGAKMMALECGVRFLTDFLGGDVYFKTNPGRPRHNLDRCATQFKLVIDIEHYWEEMAK